MTTVVKLHLLDENLKIDLGNSLQIICPYSEIRKLNINFRNESLEFYIINLSDDFQEYNYKDFDHFIVDALTFLEKIAKSRG